MFDIAKVNSQKGRTAIVTGANTGIGFETAMALAGTGMKVILACRNQQKAEGAVQKILAKVPEADLEVRIIDLGDLNSVRKFADSFLKDYQQLHVLINNAGVMMPPFSKTVDGFESQIGINYLGHFLLTGLLLNVMLETSGSRIITLSSIAHKSARINFNSFKAEQKLSGMRAYGQSKLACLMFAYELDRKLQNKELSTLSLAAHPGVSNTEIGRYIPRWAFALFSYIPFLSHKPEKGALPTLMATFDPKAGGGDYYGPTGFFEMQGKPGKVKSKSQSHDLDVAKRLWILSEELTNFKYTF